MVRSKFPCSAGRTDPGKVRLRNEDAFLDSTSQGLWVVADGLGGHQSGDIASQLIVNHLATLHPETDVQQRGEAVRRCLHWLNRRLTEELTLACDRQGGVIGSTVVALLVEQGQGICIWAGIAAVTCGAIRPCTSCRRITRFGSNGSLSHRRGLRARIDSRAITR